MADVPGSRLRYTESRTDLCGVSFQ